ncbi:hypothetical protein CWATWH8502_2428 [Crocosphaera watsonii WH 8502]|uniref:Uncharacterized protein n=5 Tax=Crocosphaera watsonii TaxID=263511 RepID=T2JQC9_CROWT|nr:hypothetical protein CWATWH0003_4790 [Crocosphaera watsonii WH 0003]CCQ51158.1 hypothetical protein CWATWH8502_2428 [Crocosphaera watsonii WH 8502]CCQ59538.1 hypothetical protein CWATWH0005_1571 [Crocosphaera watsonii WH 0005]CCQ63452.1 hypothetical protein CWATWH0401_792 [Crocosphaera watsonii WH 0401]CCQ67420.1 hypothetical protein CWATWH0402_1915 [Crocosphaera watsonii WH 0402]
MPQPPLHPPYQADMGGFGLTKASAGSRPASQGDKVLSLKS